MDTTPQLTQIDAGPAIAIRARLPVRDLPGFFGGAFQELAACAQGLMAGPPFARYHLFSGDDVDVEAVVPLRAAVAPQGRVRAIVLDASPAVQVRHEGPYDELGATYESIDHWLTTHNRQRTDAVREVYLTDPSVPPAHHVTLVIQPVDDKPA